MDKIKEFFSWATVENVIAMWQGFINTPALVYGTGFLVIFVLLILVMFMHYFMERERAKVEQGVENVPPLPFFYRVIVHIVQRICG